MQAFIHTFNSLSAPYLLYSGSLLMMYRNCSIGNHDIDFSLELDWWKDNKEMLANALVDAGFSHILTFGDIIDTWGYEEAWQMHGWKVDIFMSNSITHTLESDMIKACIGPDDEDPKGYDSVCFHFIPL